jgi:hypothetical protein
MVGQKTLRNIIENKMKTKHTKQTARVSGATVLLSCLLLLSTRCTKVESLGGIPPVSHANILNYKNSKHHIFVGFLVGDGNDPFGGYNPANAPDSVDFLEFFAGRDTIKADWRRAQAIGTRLVMSHSLVDAYFDGSINDPATKVAGYVNPDGFDQVNPTPTSTYNHWARDTYNNEVVGQGLNGIDLDIEYGNYGNQVIYGNSNGDSLVVAVAQYYGPNCTKCIVKTGDKKPVFFYDTDGTGDDDAGMYTAHKSNYDYVLFQSYTTGNRAWGGSGPADFPPLIATYGLDKLIFMVNGDSFLYANGSEDIPGENAIATASLYSYANWVKNNNGVGVGLYRMSRDYNHTPPFGVTRNAIQIMNPAKH